MSLNLISHPVMSLSDRNIGTHSNFSTFRNNSDKHMRLCGKEFYQKAFCRMPFGMGFFQGGLHIVRIQKHIHIPREQLIRSEEKGKY